MSLEYQHKLEQCFVPKCVVLVTLKKSHLFIIVHKFYGTY